MVEPMNKILVVEDEVITSELLRRYFEIMGYGVINALTGSEAIKKAINHQPAVIILDIMLPDMDGYQVCRKLRGDERTRQIPIIFLTQKDDTRARLDGLELGADDYITKPFDIEYLRQRVHHVLDPRGSEEPSTPLPGLEEIRDNLADLLEQADNVFVNIKVADFRPFAEKYGEQAASEAISGAADLIQDVLREYGVPRWFIGQPRDDHFLIALPQRFVEAVEGALPQRFSAQASQHYNQADVRQGQMATDDGPVPFMAFNVMRVKRSALSSLARSRDDGAPARLRSGRPDDQRALPPPKAD